jgi:serine/threonine protein kinase
MGLRRYLHSVKYYDVRNESQVDGIIHRDLKPDNCLITESYTLKVADFGEARAVQENNTMTQVGTPLYIAPEIVKGDHYGKSADVFSFAMTALQFSFKGRVALSDQLHEWVWREEEETKQTGLEEPPPSVSRVGHKLIAKDWRPRLRDMTKGGAKVEGIELPLTIAGLCNLCWQPDSSQRPSFEEILGYGDRAKRGPHEPRRHQGDLAGRRGGSGGLPPTTHLLARLRSKRTLSRRARLLLPQKHALSLRSLSSPASAADGRSLVALAERRAPSSPLARPLPYQTDS